MKINKKLVLIIAGLIIAAGLSFQKGTQKVSEEKSQTVVAITQIVEHPSLDLEREGILTALSEAGYTEGKNLKVIYQNAQGSSVTATQIAQKLISLHPDVIVALSTPSAQSALSAIGKNKIPLVFTAVTDPVEAKLVKDLDRPGLGLTGVSDYMPPEPQLKLVQRFAPNTKKLGIIYNPGEANSGTLYRELQKAAPGLGLTLVTATASRTGEVAAAAQSLMGRVDAIYVPTDNTAVSAIQSIVQVGIKNHIPVFAGDIGSVMNGAAGAVGYNRSVLGKAAGAKVVQFLKQGFNQEISIQDEYPIEITLNRSSVEKMGLQVPAELDPDIHWLEEK